MGGKNPQYDVNFWEFVHKKETKLYMDFIMTKVNRLKALEAKDLFALPEHEAKQTQRQISILSNELNMLYGYRLFTEEMRNCYIESIDKTYTSYSCKNHELELENHQLKQENIRLSQGYNASIDETLFCLNFYMELLEQLNLLKQKK